MINKVRKVTEGVSTTSKYTNGDVTQNVGDCNGQVADLLRSVSVEALLGREDISNVSVVLHMTDGGTKTYTPVQEVEESAEADEDDEAHSSVSA